MYLLYNGHNKSSFDHTQTQSHTNHNIPNVALTTSAVMHCVPQVVDVIKVKVYIFIYVLIGSTRIYLGKGHSFVFLLQERVYPKVVFSQSAGLVLLTHFLIEKVDYDGPV